MTQTTISRPTPRGGDDHPDAALEIVLRRTADGPVLGREPVRDGDLVEARSAVWMEAFLRRGDLAVGFDDLSWRTTTVERREAGSGTRLSGFAVRARCRRTGRTAARPFGVHALEAVATRGASALIRDGALAGGDVYVYEIAVAADGAPSADRAVAGLTIDPVSPRLRTVAAPLAPLLAAARLADPTTAPPDSSVFPVLFTDSAHRGALRHARRGADRVPAVETGCMLLGRLGSCPESGELYAIVEHAIEVRAEASRFAMTWTADTWRLVQAAADAYARPDPARRMLGQAHGHNFGLEGEPCAACAHAAVCSRSTVFVSGEDERFMRSVFARQPWALCLIAGTTLRNEPVAGLYTWRHGALRARPCHVIDDDDARRLAPGGAGPRTARSHPRQEEHP